jgi:hypothetical protein
MILRTEKSAVERFDADGDYSLNIWNKGLASGASMFRLY